MKTKIFTCIIGSLVLLYACKKDGDLIKVSGLDSSELMSSESSVVLSKGTSTFQVLALTWNESELKISDTSMSIPASVPKVIIEASAMSNFDTIIEIVPQSNTYSFTGAALNTLGKNLGFKSGVSTPMYFRVNTALGDNTKSYYSNAITVTVTCYSIDMTTGFILDSKKADTGFKLYAPKSDGEYYGFAGASAWYNWFLLEGDGTTWGNLAIDGNAFVLSNESTSWNFWYPGQPGCYYTTVSTTNKEWTATFIPSLTVSGATNATMTFDKLTVKWTASFTTTTDNTTIKVKCNNASLYNKTTGTVDASAVSKTIGFKPHSDSTLTFDWNSESAGDITISKAGDYTLTFNLADPKAWTYQLKPGKIVVAKPLSKYLYIPGIDDGISGSWTFDNFLRLTNEVDSTYAGVVRVNSKWGYQMTLDSGDWANVYQMGATEGKLKFKSGTNITAPGAGLYLIQASLKALTYSHTAMGDSIFIGGLNGNTWDFTSIILTQTSPGIYTGEVNYTTPSTYGIKIYIKKDDWNNYFGGSLSSLSYKGNNILSVQSMATGTYNVTVDFIQNKCSFVLK